jgi:hypothetical protein
VDGHRQKGLSGLPEGEGFLSHPSVMPPGTTDALYNFSIASDLNECCICLLPSSDLQIIGRLEEGEHAIMLNLIVKLVESGWHYRCTTLIDSGASGLFIDHIYATHLEAHLHQLDSPVTIQNIDGTEN